MTTNDNFPPSIYIQKQADKSTAWIKIIYNSAYTLTLKTNVFELLVGVPPHPILDCHIMLFKNRPLGLECDIHHFIFSSVIQTIRFETLFTTKAARMFLGAILYWYILLKSDLWYWDLQFDNSIQTASI